MSWHVWVRPAAETDIAEAYKWYSDQRPGLGDEFLAAPAEAMARLERDPERCAMYYHGIRRLMTERFPYKVFYTIHGTEVIVLRILQAARNHTRELGQ